MSYRIYPAENTVFFRKTSEKWGGLSNMAKGFPLLVNDIPIQSSEILYQACRFPEYPDIQKAIITNANPYEAKQVARQYHSRTRMGWEKNRISVMKWCVSVKLCQNWDTFSQLLNATGDADIVEHSEKDSFWGAGRNQDGNFYGMNVLGRILMEIRSLARDRGENGFAIIPPLPLNGFLILGDEIRPVNRRKPDATVGNTLSLF